LCRLYQELWKTGQLYEYSVYNFDDVKSVAGPLSDGWGVTTDGKSLIFSDGSDTLTYADPATLAEQKKIQVRCRTASCHLLCLPTRRCMQAHEGCWCHG
jgi:glutamine cyclotransferase